MNDQSSEEIELTLVACEFCGHDMTPFNPVAKAHICSDCLKDIQVGDRYEAEVQ